MAFEPVSSVSSELPTNSAVDFGQSSFDSLGSSDSLSGTDSLFSTAEDLFGSTTENLPGMSEGYSDVSEQFSTGMSDFTKSAGESGQNFKAMFSEIASNINHTFTEMVSSLTEKFPALAEQKPSQTPPLTQTPVDQDIPSDVPTSEAPTSEAPTSEAPTSEAPTSEAPTSEAPTSEAALPKGMENFAKSMETFMSAMTEGMPKMFEKMLEADEKGDYAGVQQAATDFETMMQEAQATFMQEMGIEEAGNSGMSGLESTNTGIYPGYESEGFDTSSYNINEQWSDSSSKASETEATAA